MKVLRDVSSSGSVGRYVVTVGNFDGVHLGHQALIRRTVEWAKAESERRSESVQSALMTFDPHPRQILKPESKFTRLFSLADQEARIRELGIDLLIVQPFSRDLSDLAPEVFLNQLILHQHIVLN